MNSNLKKEQKNSHVQFTKVLPCFSFQIQTKNKPLPLGLISFSFIQTLVLTLLYQLLRFVAFN